MIAIADGWYEKVKTYHVGIDSTTAAQLYKVITDRLPDYFEVGINMSAEFQT